MLKGFQGASFLVEPRTVIRDIGPLRRRIQNKNVRSPGMLGAVRARVMQCSAVMECCTAGRKGAGYGVSGVYMVRNQTMDCGIIADMTVGNDTLAMRTRDEVHAATLDRGGIQGHPGRHAAG